MSNGGQSNTSGVNVASVVLQPFQHGDQIPQKIRDELERIFIIKFSEDLISGNTNFYVRSKTEPVNKSVLWQEVDEVGNNIGPLKKYDFNAGEWHAVADISSALQSVEESVVQQVSQLETTINTQAETISGLKNTLSDQSDTIVNLTTRIEALEVV